MTRPAGFFGVYHISFIDVFIDTGAFPSLFGQNSSPVYQFDPIPTNSFAFTHGRPVRNLYVFFFFLCGGGGARGKI